MDKLQVSLSSFLTFIYGYLCLPFHHGTINALTAFTNYSDVLLNSRLIAATLHALITIFDPS